MVACMNVVPQHFFGVSQVIGRGQDEGVIGKEMWLLRVIVGLIHVDEKVK